MLLKKIITKSIGQYLNLLSFINPKKTQQLAYMFFSNPRTGKFKKGKFSKTLQSADKELFIHENYNFYTYTWKGNGTTILLIHGWESNSSRWKKILPYLLETKSTVIAIDAPAHGLSSGDEFTVPLYAKFINIVAEKINPSILIGHSVGGTTCMYYNHIYPKKELKKIVILGAPSDLDGMLNSFSKMMSLNKRVLVLMEYYFSIHFGIKVSDFSVTKFIEKTMPEGLLVYDKTDTLVNFSEGEKIYQVWKKAKFIETSNLGHSLHDDELYRKICLFLFENNALLEKHN